MAFDVDPHTGVVTVCGLVSVSSEQTWFWTPAWQDGERQASHELAAGEGRVFDGAAFLASLDE